MADDEVIETGGAEEPEYPEEATTRNFYAEIYEKRQLRGRRKRTPIYVPTVFNFVMDQLCECVSPINIAEAVKTTFNVEAKVQQITAIEHGLITREIIEKERLKRSVRVSHIPIARKSVRLTYTNERLEQIRVMLKEAMEAGDKPLIQDLMKLEDRLQRTAQTETSASERKNAPTINVRGDYNDRRQINIFPAEIAAEMAASIKSALTGKNVEAAKLDVPQLDGTPEEDEEDKEKS